MTTKKKTMYRPNYPISITIDASKGEKEIIEEKSYITTQQEASRLRAVKDNELLQQQYKNATTGIFAYSNAVKYRNSQHEKLDAYRVKPREELQKIFVEYVDLAQRRGLPLGSDDIDFGRIFLEQLLSKPQPEPEPKTLKQKLIDMVT